MRRDAACTGRVALQDQVVLRQRLQRRLSHGAERGGDESLDGLGQLPKWVRLRDRQADVEVLVDRALALADDRLCGAVREVRARIDELLAPCRREQRHHGSVLARDALKGGGHRFGVSAQNWKRREVRALHNFHVAARRHG